MHNVVQVDVVECSEQLICVQLYKHRVDLLSQVQEVLLNAIDIGRDIIHHDVELRFIFLLFLLLFLSLLGWRFLVELDEVSVAHPNDVLMVHFFMNLQLTTLKLLVLLELFDCHDLTSRL